MSVCQRSLVCERIGVGEWSGTMSDNWMIGKVVSGGYVTTVVLYCALQELQHIESPHKDVLTANAHFLRAVMPGKYTVLVEVVKSGRTTATLHLKMLQEGKEKMRLLVTCGNIEEAKKQGPNFSRIDKDTAPPELPPITECKRLSYIGDNRNNNMVSRVDIRIPVQDFNRYREARSYKADLSVDDQALEKRREMLSGDNVGPAEYACYCSFDEKSDVLLVDAPVLLDATVPAIMGVYPTGWVPTVNWTVQFKQKPVAGLLRMRIKTSHVVGGFLEEDAELWDSQDNLIAFSRQLAMVNVTQPTQRKSKL